MIDQDIDLHPVFAVAARWWVPSAIGRPDAEVGEVPVVYVQLRTGSRITVDDLLTFGSGAIGERAAVPKAVRIVDTLPLTAIGKVHKPTLRVLEAEDAARSAIDRSGVRAATVVGSLRDDGGIDIRVDAAEGDRETIRTTLAPFAFASDVNALST